MRKRLTEHSDESHVSPSILLQTKTTECQEKKGLLSKLWLWVKRGSFALCAFCLIMPILVELPEMIKQRIYYHRIRVPFVFDLGQPAELELNHTVNMYLTPEEGISLGVWHTVPDFMWKEAQGKDSAWYQRSLKDGSPVFIYLHGKTQTRAAKHRIGVINVLSAIGYHVLSVDYRGYGDSTGQANEEGFTTDALCLFRWVKERSGDSRVIIWGHSVGTGVITNMAVRLMKQGVLLDGVILEGAFLNADVYKPHNPFALLVTRYWLAIVTLLRRDQLDLSAIFPSDENLKTMKCPILFLHAEDDHISWFHNAQKLYQIALSAQDAERVKMEVFEGSLGYLHNGLYIDPRLPPIIKKFVLSVGRIVGMNFAVQG